MKTLKEDIQELIEQIERRIEVAKQCMINSERYQDRFVEVENAAAWYELVNIKCKLQAILSRQDHTII